MAQKEKDELAGALHETASGLFEAGLLPKSTMREIDELCLTPVEDLTPEQIKAIREKSHYERGQFF